MSGINVGSINKYVIDGSIILESSSSIIDPNAYANGYLHRKLITQDHTLISGSSDLLNFPVLVSLTDILLTSTSVGGHVQSPTGLDIRFEDVSGSKLDHEVERWDSVSGSLVAWVRIPILTYSTDTTFYLYYGNASIVTSEQNATGVWDSGYQGVYHFGDGTTLNINDSTINAYTGSISSGSVIAGTSSIGGMSSAVFSSGSLNTGTAFYTSAQTIEMWVNIDTNPLQSLISNYNGYSSDSFLYSDGGKIFTSVDDWSGNSVSANTVVSSFVWHLVTATAAISGTTSAITAIIFIDGNAMQSGSFNYRSFPIADISHPFIIGNSINGTLNGAMSETRISNVVRTPNWIATTYAAQSSPSTFLSFGSEESSVTGSSSVTASVATTGNNVSSNIGSVIVVGNSISGGTGNNVSSNIGSVIVVITSAPVTTYANGYLHRKLITQDHTLISGSSDLSNFPVLVSVTDSLLATTTNSGHVQSATGLDIRFELVDGTKLDHEVETWSATTGNFIAWVRIPTLTYVTDTTFYLYYGNPSVISSEQNATGVWDSYTESVLHYGDGTTLVIADSSGNTIPLNSGSTATTGKIGGGMQCHLSPSRWVDSGWTPHFTSPPEFTIQTLFKLQSTDNTSPISMLFGTSEAYPGSDLEIEFNSDGTVAGSYNGSSGGSTVFPSVAVNYKDDVWHLLAFRAIASGSLDVIIDGVVKATYTNSATSLIASSSLWIGSLGGYPGYEFSGQIDETRIALTARSNDWLSADYATQNSPSTFLSFGSEQSPVSSSFTSVSFATTGNNVSSNIGSVIVVGNSISGGTGNNVSSNIGSVIVVGNSTVDISGVSSTSSIGSSSITILLPPSTSVTVTGVSVTSSIGTSSVSIVNLVAFDHAVNIRATAGFVTDGANETYYLGASSGEDGAYPISRGGATFGFTTSMGDDVRDRETGIDRRIAGEAFNANTGTQHDFRFDVPTSGSYTVHIGACDYYYGAREYIEIRDGNGLLVVVSSGSLLLGVNNAPAYIATAMDATGAIYTASAWGANETGVDVILTTPYLIIRIGSNTNLGDSTSTSLSHVRLVSNPISAPINISSSVFVSGSQASSSIRNININASATSNLSGASASSNIGTIGIITNSNETVNGVSGTTLIGNVNVAANSIIGSISGVSITTSIGTVTISLTIPISVFPTGDSVVANVGMFYPNCYANPPPIGCAVGSMAGASKISANANTNITGISSIISTGIISVTSTDHISVSGVSVSSNIGNASIQTVGNPSIRVVSAASNIGVETVTACANTNISGNSVTTNIGTTTVTVLGIVAVNISGISGVSVVNGVRVAAAANENIIGIPAITSTHSPNISIGISPIATGNTLSANIGNESVNATATTKTLGISSTSNIKNVRVITSANVYPSGIQAILATGIINISVLGKVQINVGGVTTSTNVTGVRVVASANETVNGVSSTSSTYISTISLGKWISTSGNSSITSIGNVSVSGNENTSLNGTNVISSVSTPNVIASSIVNVSGLQATSNIGSSILSGINKLSLTGVNVVTSVGTVLISANGTAVATNVSASTSIGTISGYGNADVDPLGNNAVISIGNVIIALGNIPAIGVSGNTNIGVITVQANALSDISGNSITTNIGTVSIIIQSILGIVGVQGVTNVADVSIVADSILQSSGIYGITSIGTIDVVVESIATIVGVSVQTSVGSVIIVATSIEAPDYVSILPLGVTTIIVQVPVALNMITTPLVDTTTSVTQILPSPKPTLIVKLIPNT